ncbi:hypothetical protein Tco_1040368 [Tanacetum coccineum]
MQMAPPVLPPWKRETEVTTDKEQTNFQGIPLKTTSIFIPISIPEPDVQKTLPKTILKSDIPKSLPKPNIPYPSRRDDRKSRNKASNQMEKIFQIFQINDPLHHEFAGGVITIPPRIVRKHEDYISRMSLLCGNSSSRSPENFHTIIESLPISTTLVEDSDSNREEIDIFSGSDDSIPPGIESDFDSEEDIIDNLLNDDPIPEYERLTFDMKPDVPVINNVYELNEDECFDPGGGKINVEVDDSFTFVIRTFLLYLTYPEVSLLLSSTENEDTIFDPGIFAFHFSSQEPVVVKCFMEFCSSTCFIPKDE